MPLIASSLLALVGAVHLYIATASWSEEERGRQASWLKQSVVGWRRHRTPRTSAAESGAHAMTATADAEPLVPLRPRSSVASAAHVDEQTATAARDMQGAPASQPQPTRRAPAPFSRAERRASVHLTHYITVPPALVVPMVTVDM